MPDIDSLSIKISAEASAANKAIGTLSQNLSTLSHNLGKLNGSSLSNFSSAMQNLSVGMKNLQGIKAKDFTPIASGIKKFQDINTGKISSVGGSLKTLASGLNTISGMSFNTESLNGISSALSKLGSVKGTAGADNLLKIKNSLSQFVTGMNRIGSVTFDATNLSNLITSISRLGNTGANNATKNLPTISAQLQNFVNQLNKIGSLTFDTTNLSNLITSISKLGYKGVTTATANLPALTRELNNLMTTLSKAPQVNNNVIQMTNALANLASQGGRVGTASRTLVNGLNNSSNAMSRATKSSKSLAAAFGKFYASWFLVIRGIKKLWSSIESSMDYVEVLNYFDAAFEQVAQKADLSSFQQLGYDSAEEYAKSFSERAKELTAQMTGFAVTEKGTLEATGMPSLGLDPSQLMNYQAMFGQMASSMGVASETSLKLSRALTEIGADLASVKNMDFDKVWTDMASGLAGMSRTLDKYGVNIRNVNLQQKLSELGIEANITALNQNDKALLRTIILLDSTRYAWGDLADTINQPANQIRLLEANFNNLSRTIGNIFLPIVAKVLPYVNGLVIALQKLAEWIVKLLSFEDFDWGGISGIGGIDISDFLEDTEDASGALNNASQAVKKLKGQIRGFDELNVINTQDTGGTGLGTSGGTGFDSSLLEGALDDILSEYQTVWDKAFEEMENRTQKFADKIVGFFNKMYIASEPFRESVKRLWNEGLSKLSDFSWTVLKDFYEQALVPIGTWAFGTQEEGFTRFSDIVNNSLNAINWESLNTSLKNFWIAIEPYAEQFGEGLIDFFEGLSNIAVDVINKIPNILDRFTNTLNNGDPEKARSLARALEGLAVAFLAFKGIGAAITSVVGIGDAVAKLSTTFTTLSTTFAPVTSFFSKIGETFALASGGAGTFGEAISAVFPKFAAIAPQVAIITTAVIAIIATITDLWKTSEQFRGSVINAFNSVKDSILNAFEKIGESIEPLWDKIKELGSSLYELYETSGLKEIAELVFSLIADISGFAISFLIDDIATSLSGLIDMISGAVDVLTGISDILVGIFTLDFDRIKGGFSNILEGLEGLGNGYSKFMLGSLGEAIRKGLEDAWSGISNWFKKNVADPISKSAKTIWKNASGFFTNLWNDIVAIFTPVINWFNENVINPVVQKFNFLKNTISKVFEGIWIIAEAIGIKMSEFFNKNVITPIVSRFNYLKENITLAFQIAKNSILNVWNNVTGWFNANIIVPVTSSFNQLRSRIGDAFSTAKNLVLSVWSNVAGWFNSNIITPIINTFNRIIQPIKNAFSNAFSGIKSVAVSAINSAISAIEKGLNKIRDGLNFVINGFNRLVSSSAKITGAKAWSGLNTIGYISLGRVPQYSVGGFPEDGLFYANHDELVGKFNNGRTAVANNEQITQGIADAVYPAVYNAVSAAMKNNAGDSNVTFQVEGDPNGLFKVVRKEADVYFRRTGNPAFSQ